MNPIPPINYPIPTVPIEPKPTESPKPILDWPSIDFGD